MMQFNNLMKISEVAQLIPGAPKNIYSDKKATSLTECLVLKGNDVDHDGNISTDNMESALLSDGNRSVRYLLQEGDVIVMARGTAMRVGLVTKDIAKTSIITTANFIIIRPDKNKIRGEVIFAFFRSALGKQLIKSLSTGSVIQNIPVSSLRNTEIPVPPIEKQSKISNLLSVAQKARHDALELIEQQRRTVDATILELMV